jgi:hypothetical protein
MLPTLTAVQAAKARGLVTLRDVCDEYHLEPAAARARLRQANIKPTDGA